MNRPWDQQPGESDERYTRFLLYRNIGPSRSLRKAYYHYLQEYDGFRGPIKGVRPPHQWAADSSQWGWVARSSAWDVHNLTGHGSRIVALHFQAMTKVAEKNLKWAARLDPGDDGFADLIRSMQMIQNMLTPDLVRGIKDEPARRPADAPADVE